MLLMLFNLICVLCVLLWWGRFYFYLWRCRWSGWHPLRLVFILGEVIFHFNVSRYVLLVLCWVIVWVELLLSSFRLFIFFFVNFWHVLHVNFLSLDKFINPGLLLLIFLIVSLVHMLESLLHPSLNLLLECLLLPDLLEHAVEPVFNLVLSAPWDLLGYLSPLITDLFLFFEEH